VRTAVLASGWGRVKDFWRTGTHTPAVAACLCVLLPLQCCLVTPETQWQPRSQWRLSLTGALVHGCLAGGPRLRPGRACESDPQPGGQLLLLRARSGFATGGGKNPFKTVYWPLNYTSNPGLNVSRKVGYSCTARTHTCDMTVSDTETAFGRTPHRRRWSTRRYGHPRVARSQTGLSASQPASVSQFPSLQDTHSPCKILTVPVRYTQCTYGVSHLQGAGRLLSIPSYLAAVCFDWDLAAAAAALSEGVCTPTHPIPSYPCSAPVPHFLRTALVRATNLHHPVYSPLTYPL
jgi:hypothetical protein